MMSERRQAAADAEEHVCELIAEARKGYWCVLTIDTLHSMDLLTVETQRRSQQSLRLSVATCRSTIWQTRTTLRCLSS